MAMATHVDKHEHEEYKENGFQDADCRYTRPVYCKMELEVR